jgi:outer membrane protein assembly factor BamB
MKTLKFVISFLLVISLIIGGYPGIIDANSANENCDWPMFGNNPARTSYSSCGPVSSELELLWSTDISDHEFSSPIVVDGKLFIASIRTDINDTGYAFCLDSTNGKVNWKKRIVTDFGSLVTPAYDNGKVLFLSSPDLTLEKISDADRKNCFVVCFDADNGKIEWKFKSGAPFLLGSPLIDDGYAYFNDYSGGYYSYSMKRGSKKWKTGHQTCAASMSASKGKLYCVDMDGYLKSIYTKSGKIARKGPKINKEGRCSNPIVHDGVVYVGSDKGYMYAYDSVSFKKKWEFKTEEGIWAQPSIYEGKLYFSTGHPSDSSFSALFGDYKTHCLDAKTGKEIWNDKVERTLQSPSISGDFVYVPSGNSFKMYNRKTGSLVWSHSVNAWYYSSPAIADNKVYIASNDGTVQCFGAPPISPTSIDFGKVTPDEKATEHFTITSLEPSKTTYKISSKSSWIKVSQSSVKLSTKQKKIITVSVDYNKLSKNTKNNSGTITVTWGKQVKRISVHAYSKPEGDGGVNDFSACDGWNELGANNINSNSIVEECNPLSAVLELDWKREIIIDDIKHNNSLYCFDDMILFQGSDLHNYKLKDGSHNWSTEGEGLAFSSSAHIYGNIYFGNGKGIKSVNSETGEVAYEKIINDSLFNIDTMVAQPKPSIFDESIYFSYENSIFSLQNNDKKLRKIYTDTENSTLFTHPIVTDKHIIFRDGGLIQALDRVSGKKIWSFSCPDDEYIGDMAVSGNRLFLNQYPEKDEDEPDQFSTIICKDITTGRQEWRYKLDELVFGEFAVDEKFIYFGSAGGKVYCMPVDRDRIQWTKRVDSPIYEAPILSGDGLFITTTNKDDDSGKVYRLKKADGEVTWEYEFEGVPVANPVVSDGRFIIMTEKDEDDESAILYSFKGFPLGDPSIIEATPENIEIEIDDSVTLDVKVKDENGYKLSEIDLTFTSSDESICTVDEAGKIVAVEIGECEITVQHADITDTVNIKVVDRINPTFEKLIDFEIIDVDDLPTKEIQINNLSVKPITIKISGADQWLILDHYRFELISKGSGILQVSFDPTEIPLGMDLECVLKVDWGYGEAEIVVRAKVKGPGVSPNQIEAGEIELDEVVTEEISLNNTASTWIDMKVSSDSDWLTVDPVEFTLKKMGSEKIGISIDTRGLFLGNEYNGVVRFEWRKGGFIEVPVSFTTPADDVAPTITILPIEDQIVATECEILIETDEVCIVMIGETEAVLNEEETHYVATVPLSPAPSINEFEVTATDMAGNESKETIEVKNIDKLVVTMQIGSNVMTVRGEEKPIEPAPTVISGSTMVPVRAVSEAFGAQVDWRAETKTVIITLGESIIILSVNSTDAYVNNEPTKVEPPPQLISGSTMLPFRFIAEALGATIDWNGETKTITITKLIMP